MQPFKEQKVEEHLKHLAAEFIQRETNGTSLITVTSAQMSDKLSRVHIFVTVLPETKLAEAIHFLNRNRPEFKDYIKKHSRIGRLPTVEFAPDFGEKNRQRIDELSVEEEHRTSTSENDTGDNNSNSDNQVITEVENVNDIDSELTDDDSSERAVSTA